MPAFSRTARRRVGQRERAGSGRPRSGGRRPQPVRSSADGAVADVDLDGRGGPPLGAARPRDPDDLVPEFPRGAPRAATRGTLSRR